MTARTIMPITARFFENFALITTMLRPILSGADAKCPILTAGLVLSYDRAWPNITCNL